MEIIAREKALVRLANKASTDLSGKEGFIAEASCAARPQARSRSATS